MKIGITAPSGTNSQVWTFTLLPDRKAVAAFGEQVALFFKGINKAAENAFPRTSLRLIGRKELSDYYRDYYESVKKAILLFHGATAAIFVASRPGGSTSREDALLAAHSIGLGSCLIGFAVVPLNKDIRIKRFVGIPDDERIHAVIALGYPDERYLRLPGRKGYVQRFADCE